MTWRTDIPAYDEVEGKCIVYRFAGREYTYTQNMRNMADYTYIFKFEPIPAKWLLLD